MVTTAKHSSKVIVVSPVRVILVTMRGYTFQMRIMCRSPDIDTLQPPSEHSEHIIVGT